MNRNTRVPQRRRSCGTCVLQSLWARPLNHNRSMYGGVGLRAQLHRLRIQRSTDKHTHTHTHRCLTVQSSTDGRRPPLTHSYEKKEKKKESSGDTVTMTTEYHDDVEDDSSSFWNKEPSPVSLSGVSRFRRWLFPVVMATFILVLIIAVGATNAKTMNQLWSTEKKVSNLSEGLTNTQQLTKDAAKDVHRLKFAVEYNKDQLSSVSEALKQLSALDTLSRTVASLKCSLERLIHNTSAVDGCCPLDWDQFGSSCYLFSKTALAWHNARDWCNGHEAHLVILITDDDWDFVNRHAMGTFYWVGLTDERTGKWEWVNQTPYVMNRRRWKPGQPDAWTEHGLGPGDEDCAHLHSDGRLNDLHCSSRMRFICQSHAVRS